jgi:hypothetical protein
LNIALKRMEQDKVAISRSWDSWTGLASGIVDVMRRTMAASNAPKPSADIETDQPEPLESAIEQPVPTQKPIQPQRRAKKNRRKR